MHRLVTVTLLSGLLAAQKPAPQQTTAPPQEPPEGTTRIVVESTYVSTPALVFDRDGNYVNNLRADQFRLFDNDKEQNINVDVTFVPISLVICIQSNSHVENTLPQVRKIGNLIKPLITGEQGEVALIAYDSRIRVLQEFTSDPDKITEKIKTITPGSSSNRMIDAVDEGRRLLSSRPRNRRRILLLIGETRDVSSEMRAREALINLQLSNVLFYAVDMSRFMTTLMAPTPVGRPDTLPPAMHPMPSGVPATPTTVAQTYGYNAGRAEFIPLMVELFKDAKAIFKDNPVELFTKGTGGSEFGFHSSRTLEEAVQRVGEELHAGYTISYAPNNRTEGGFHTIKVDIPTRPDVKRVQTRPGYWLGR